MNRLEQPLLRIENLSIAYGGAGGPRLAVDDVSLSLEANQVLALVGESGSGKSSLANAVFGLLPPGGRLAGGQVLLQGQDVWAMNPRQLRRLRRKAIALISQEGAASLDPLLSLGAHMREALRLQGQGSRQEAKQRGASLITRLGLYPAEEFWGKYPHQLSGGQIRRLLIALALAGDPSLLVADEPFTGLDMTVQAQIFQLLRRLRQERRLSLLLISHDLASVAGLAERVAVLYAGRVMEQGGAADIYYRPCHPYTQGLLAASPKAGEKLVPIPGQPGAAPVNPASCPFALRCREAMHICLRQRPELAEVSPGHQAACWLTMKL